MGLEQTLPIFFIFLVGLGLKWMKVLRAEHGQMLSQIIFYISLPAAIINAVSSMDIQPRLFLLPVAGLILVTTLLCLGFALAPLLGLGQATRGAFVVAFPTLELGSIGYAALVAAYGLDGLATIALIDLGNAFFIFTVVALVASLQGQAAERFHLATALLRFAKSPVLWAYLAGVAMSSFHLHIPLLSNFFSALAQSLLLLLMLLIAVEFKFEMNLSSLVLPAIAMYVKMAVGVCVGLLISLLFHFSGMTRIAFVLAASLPASLMTVVYAREHALDTGFLTSMLSLALPVSIFSSAVFIAIAH